MLIHTEVGDELDGQHKRVRVGMIIHFCEFNPLASFEAVIKMMPVLVFVTTPLNMDIRVLA
jgi:hypothetical protein